MQLPQKGPFIIESTRQIYKNPWIEVTEDTVLRPDSTKGIFGTIDMKDGVAILPIYPDGRVVLAQEFKYAQNREMIEIIGGGIDMATNRSQKQPLANWRKKPDYVQDNLFISA